AVGRRLIGTDAIAKPACRSIGRCGLKSADGSAPAGGRSRAAKEIGIDARVRMSPPDKWAVGCRRRVECADSRAGDAGICKAALSGRAGAVVGAADEVGGPLYVNIFLVTVEQAALPRLAVGRLADEQIIAHQDTSSRRAGAADQAVAFAGDGVVDQRRIDISTQPEKDRIAGG